MDYLILIVRFKYSKSLTNEGKDKNSNNISCFGIIVSCSSISVKDLNLNLQKLVVRL